MSTDSKTETEIGEHDPVVMMSKKLEFWVECECGWIGPSMLSPSRAREAHERHVESIPEVS